MAFNLIGDGGFGCVYYDSGINCDGKPDKDKEYITKLEKKDIDSNNEIEISNIVKKIDNYERFYAPIESTCDIKLRQLNKSIIKDCPIVDQEETDKYILMRIPYINKEDFFSAITDKCEDNKNPILQMIDTYQFLLNSIKKLIEKKIVHFDINAANIVYSKILQTPMLIDFGISINIDYLLQNIDNDDIVSNIFYAHDPTQYRWPIEVHIITYLTRKGDVLDKHIIDNICDDYVNANKAFKLYSTEFRKKYIENASQYYYKFIKYEKQDTIKELVTYWETWDNYALSITLLRYIGFIFDNGFFDNRFIINFSQLFITNCHYDPNIRKNIKECVSDIASVFFKENDPKKYISLVTNIKYKKEEVLTKIESEHYSTPSKIESLSFT